MSSSSNYSDEEESESEDGEFSPWIVDWCTNISGNEWFVQVSLDWIADRFNMGHFPACVPNFEDAYKIVMDKMSLKDIEDPTRKELMERCSELLYGMIHSRYILTPCGMNMMIQKWESGLYGRCPRLNCENAHFLPVGTCYLPCKSTVKLYCPRCQELYKIKNSKHKTIDGAYFGPEFPHVLFIMHPELRPKPAKKYEPRIWGFKISPEAYTIQYDAALKREVAIREKAVKEGKIKDKSEKVDKKPEEMELEDIGAGSDEPMYEEGKGVVEVAVDTKQQDAVSKVTDWFNKVDVELDEESPHSGSDQPVYDSA